MKYDQSLKSVRLISQKGMNEGDQAAMLWEVTRGVHATHADADCWEIMREVKARVTTKFRTTGKTKPRNRPSWNFCVLANRAAGALSLTTSVCARFDIGGTHQLIAWVL